jgi:Glycosyltransferase 61
LSARRSRATKSHHRHHHGMPSSSSTLLLLRPARTRQGDSGRRCCFFCYTSNHRTRAILFFGMCGFLPVLQWFGGYSSKNNNDPSLDYFNYIVYSSPSSANDNDQSSSSLSSSIRSGVDSGTAAAIAMAMLGLYSSSNDDNHAAAILVNNATSCSSSSPSLIGDGRVRKIAKGESVHHAAKAVNRDFAAADKELLHVLPSTPAIVGTAASSSSLPALAASDDDEMCSTTSDTQEVVVTAVTEADEAGFFIRTSYPKSYPIEDVVLVEERNKQSTKLTIISTGAFQNNKNPTTPTTRAAAAAAVCEFRHNLPNSHHFPHTMQQLYRCWSWWQYHANHTAATPSSSSSSSSSAAAAAAAAPFQPILVLKRARIQQRHVNRASSSSSVLGNNRFVQGFLNALKTSINLTIVYDDDEQLFTPTSSSDELAFAMVTAKPQLESNRDLYDYRMHSIQDGPHLRATVLQTLTATTTTTMANSTRREDALLVTEDATSQPVCLHNFPRVTILNRRKTRRILNVQELQRAILGLLRGDSISISTTKTTQPGTVAMGNNNNNNNNNNSNDMDVVVRVEYFEGRSFADQVSVMSNTDILISPHGAQLTGLVFLPSPCSAVLEIFPRGYWIPKFFGSLAATSGVHQHACLYLGASNSAIINRTQQVHESTQTLRDRIRTRSQNICLPVNRTLQAIQQMIHSWQQCCSGNKDTVAQYQESKSTTTTRP